jgi:hypothetical protein
MTVQHHETLAGQRFLQPLRFAWELCTKQVDCWPWALLAGAMAAVLLGSGFFVTVATGKPFVFLIRDANAIAQQPLYFGGLEHAGVLLMSGAGWIALFSAVLSKGRSTRFLGLGGLLTLMLACDDLYMLHESSWRFGISEKVVFGFYAALAVLFVATNVRQFLNSPFLLLGVAMASFACAIVIDALPQPPEGMPSGFEDWFELIGISFWSVYFVKCSRDVMRAQPSTGK